MAILKPMLGKVIVVLLCSLIAACQLSPNVLDKQEAQQLVVVVSADWNASKAQMLTFTRYEDKWVAAGIDEPVNIGRNGMGWGIGLHPEQDGYHKQEGDGRAPAGVFNLSGSFGYLDEVVTSMPYEQMQATDYCIDVNQSPFYNQVIDAKQQGQEAIEGSTEPMRRDIHKQQDVYKKGIFVQHNPDNISGQGSCIFMHLWFDDGVATAGCTSMHESVMDRLLLWLKPEQKPLMVALPLNEYRRLQSQWGLPELAM